MKTFKDIAYDILKKAGKPLHSKAITEIALKQGVLITEGKTPEATMNAHLIVDVNTKGSKSRFVKTAPSTFYININWKPVVEKEKEYKASRHISTRQKGDIAEARIAELITLYGDANLSCYKPISDDDGIDIVVKEKKTENNYYIQVKSRFNDDLKNVSVMSVKTDTITNSPIMGIVFCLFDTSRGDLWDYLWLVPAKDFIDMASKQDGGKRLIFVAGKQRRDSNKWDKYLIDKRDLANQVVKLMN